jgi:hypothetical protein
MQHAAHHTLRRRTSGSAATAQSVQTGASPSCGRKWPSCGALQKTSTRLGCTLSSQVRQRCMPHVARRTLHVACRTLHVACRTLHAARCMLHAAHCMLPHVVDCVLSGHAAELDRLRAELHRAHAAAHAADHVTILSHAPRPPALPAPPRPVTQLDLVLAQSRTCARARWAPHAHECVRAAMGVRAPLLATGPHGGVGLTWSSQERAALAAERLARDAKHAAEVEGRRCCVAIPLAWFLLSLFLLSPFHFPRCCTIG